MARELRIDVWCDVCLADGQHEAGEPYEGLTLDGKPRVLDLCERDRKTYVAPLAELLESLGRKPEEEPRAKRAYTRRAAPAAAPDLEGVECLICGHRSPNGSALGAHLSQRHDLKVTEMFGGTCPVCGEVKGGTHVKVVHGLTDGMAGAFAWAEAHGDPHGVVAERRAALA